MTHTPPPHHAASVREAPPAPAQTPFSPAQTIIGVVCLVLVLWLAYRIGKVILRLVVGMLFLGLIIYGIWYLFIK